MSETARAVLRAMSVADLIDEIFRLYRRNFGLLFGLTAVIWLPASTLFSVGFAIVGRASTQVTPLQVADLGTGVLVLIVGAVIGFVTFPLLVGGTTHAVAERYLDRGTTVGRSFRTAVRSFWRLVGGYLVVAIAAFAAFGLGIVLGVGVGALLQNVVGILLAIALVGGAMVSAVWIVMTWALLPQAVVVEDAGVLGALRRSAHLANGARWRIIGINLLLGLIGVVLFSIPSAFVSIILTPLPLPPAASFALSQVIAALAQAVYYPVQLGTMTLLYFDLRVRREGFDLALAAERLRSAP